MEEIKCIGCGALLQSTDQNKPGYVSENILYGTSLERVVCKRCHQIKNYNLISKNEMSTEQYYKILKKISSKDALFVYVVDVFNLSSTLNKEVIELIKEKDILLVVNKIDLLPKSLKEGKLSLWIRHQAKLLGLKVKDIILISVQKKHHIDELVNMIDRYRYKRNVYVIGSTNVGKSSLINQMLRSEGMLDYDLITTSIIPATTLSLIEIPFFEKGILYDTPGLVNDDNLLSLVDAKDFKIIMPKTEIKPKVYQLSDKQSLLISGFACFNYLEGGNNNFVLYFSNTLPIQRSKYERAVEIFPSKVKDMFDINTKELEYETLEFEVNKPSDVVISGLGFIAIKNAPAKVSVTVVKGCGVMLREPIIG